MKTTKVLGERCPKQTEINVTFKKEVEREDEYGRKV
jgi:hypothetical protein